MQFTVAVVQREVLVEAAQHRRKMLLLFASFPMPVLRAATHVCAQKILATLDAGNADQGKAPAPVYPTDMLEAKELKRLRPLSVLAPRGGGKASKEQLSEFSPGHLQIELRKPLLQLTLKSLRIPLNWKLPTKSSAKRTRYASPWHCGLNFFSNHRSSVKCKYRFCSTGEIRTALRSSFPG